MRLKRKLFSAGYNNIDNRLKVVEFRTKDYKPFGPWESEYTPNAKIELENHPDKDL